MTLLLVDLYFLEKVGGGPKAPSPPAYERKLKSSLIGTNGKRLPNHKETKEKCLSSDSQ